MAIKMVLFNLLIRNLESLEKKKDSEIKNTKLVFTATVTAHFLVFKPSTHCSNRKIHGGIWLFIKLTISTKIEEIPEHDSELR